MHRVIHKRVDVQFGSTLRPWYHPGLFYVWNIDIRPCCIKQRSYIITSLVHCRRSSLSFHSIQVLVVIWGGLISIKLCSSFWKIKLLMLLSNLFCWSGRSKTKDLWKHGAKQRFGRRVVLLLRSIRIMVLF